MVYHPYDKVKRFIAIDCVIFGYEEELLKLLLFRRNIEPSKGQWSLIGGWVNEDESVEDAARRILHSITGLKDIFLEQIGVFSKPDRDPGGNVLTVAFNALIKIERHSNEMLKEFGAQWVPMNQVPPLIFDHNEILRLAYEKLQLTATYNLIGRQLLPEKFTLTQLRNLYQAVFQKTIDPGNFRKKLISLKLLERLDEKERTESRKGAFYYRFKEHPVCNEGEPIFRNTLKF